MPNESYIEIVHLDPGLVNLFAHLEVPQFSPVSQNILALRKQGRDVHFFTGIEFDRSLPSVPADAPIILGGVFGDVCV